jgi:hypothetical protein
MKVIKLIVLTALLNACSGFGAKRTEPERDYPLFLTGGKKTAAFKITADTSPAFSAVLLLSKQTDGYKIKIIGDYASDLLAARFDGVEFNYNLAADKIFDKASQKAFEEFIRLLLVKPSGFINANALREGGEQINFKRNGYIYKYRFQKNSNLPYELEQIKKLSRNKITFGEYTDYGGQKLPSKITFSSSYGLFKADISVLSVK